MDPGRVVSPAVTDGLSSNNDDPEDLDDFVLRLDEDDINVSDDALKEEELLNPPEDNEIEEVIPKNSHGPVTSKPDQEISEARLELEEKEKIDQGNHINFRNSNHERVSSGLDEPRDTKSGSESSEKQEVKQHKDEVESNKGITKSDSDLLLIRCESDTNVVKVDKEDLNIKDVMSSSGDNECDISSQESGVNESSASECDNNVLSTISDSNSVTSTNESNSDKPISSKVGTNFEVNSMDDSDSELSVQNVSTESKLNNYEIPDAIEEFVNDKNILGTSNKKFDDSKITEEAHSKPIDVELKKKVISNVDSSDVDMDKEVKSEDEKFQLLDKELDSLLQIDDETFGVKSEDEFQDEEVVKKECQKASEGVSTDLDEEISGSCKTYLNISPSDLKKDEFTSPPSTKTLMDTDRRENLLGNNVTNSLSRNVTSADDGCENDSDFMDFEDTQINSCGSDGSLEDFISKDTTKPLPVSENDKDTLTHKSNKRGAEHNSEGNNKKPKLNGFEEKIYQLFNGYSKTNKMGINDDSSEEAIGEVASTLTPDELLKLLNGYTLAGSRILNRQKSNENPEFYEQANQKIFQFYMEGKRQVLIDLDTLEELLMLKIVEYIAHGRSTSCKEDFAYFKQRNRFLEDEQLRLVKNANSLKKQVEDCKHIIKKLIDEKTNNAPWTQHAMPLRVTRSVGLQVCTCGTVNMTNSKTKDADSVRQLLKQAKSNNSVTSNSTSPGGVNNNATSNNNYESNDNDDVMVVGEQPPTTQRKIELLRPLMGLYKKTRPYPPSSKVANAQSRVQPPLKNGMVTHQIKPSSATKLSKPIQPTSRNTPQSLEPKDPLAKTTSAENSPELPATIDLTDNDDVPSKIETNSSQQPCVSVKPMAALCKPDKPSPAKENDLSLRGLLVSKNRIPPTSSPISTKRPCVSSAGAELVTSFEKLPKFPPSPKYPADVSRPPRPNLRIGKNNSGKQGIMLSWSFDPGKSPQNIEEYQLYAFQESKSSDKSKPDSWKKVGDIKALPLPMACFLTQFVEGHKYHFIVRAVDKHKRLGDFSLPGSIILQSPVSAAATTTPPASAKPT